MKKVKDFFINKYYIINHLIIYFLLLSMSLFLSTDYFPIIEIILAFISLYIFIFCIIQKMKPLVTFIKSSFFIWYLLFWIFVIIVTLIKNTGESIVLIKTIIAFSAFIFEFGVLYYDDKTRETIQISNVMETIAVILSVWILIFEFPLLIEGKRIGYSVMIGNPNSAGCLLSIYLFFITYNITQKEKSKKIKHILALLLCFGVILATGSKKAIIMGIIAFLIFLFQNGHIIKKRLIYFVIFLVVAVVSCLYVPVLYQNIGRRFLSLFGELGIIEFQTDHSSELRIDYTEKATELWKDDILIGGGYNNFRVNSGYQTYSHNNYMELLTTVGLIGTTIYYGYYLFLMIKIFRKKNMRNIIYGLFIISVFATDIGAVIFYVYPLYYIILVVIDQFIEQQDRGKHME